MAVTARQDRHETPRTDLGRPERLRTTAGAAAHNGRSGQGRGPTAISPR
jgi:hypothetical protein